MLSENEKLRAQLEKAQKTIKKAEEEKTKKEKKEKQKLSRSERYSQLRQGEKNCFKGFLEYYYGNPNSCCIIVRGILFLAFFGLGLSTAIATSYLWFLGYIIPCYAGAIIGHILASINALCKPNEGDC